MPPDLVCHPCMTHVCVTLDFSGQGQLRTVPFGGGRLLGGTTRSIDKTARQQSDRCPDLQEGSLNLPDIPSFQTEILSTGGAAELSAPGGGETPRTMAGQLHADGRGERAHWRGERAFPGAEAP
jgi:hypothetical protein